MDVSGRESGPHNASSDLCKFEDELIPGGSGVINSDYLPIHLLTLSFTLYVVAN